MAQSSATTPELRSIDPQVWKACAGSGASIPVAGTLAYYFPHGHAEHAAVSSEFPIRAGAVLCRVSVVRLLASSDTDEVFTSIALDPRPLNPSAPPSPLDVAADGFLSFAKILTPSDANNGGGFSVPRFCADSIFPPLDYSADPPLQTIVVSDVHGVEWRFRHIFRGTPRRHLLTTGWSKFVNSKKLVAGDSVVFMRNQRGKLFVGIRRLVRSIGPEYSSHRSPIKFNQNDKSRVSVEEAVRSVEEKLPFEVVYYPRAGLPEFVVAQEAVETAMKLPWTAGMRVRMPVESEDPARTTWFQGTVSSVVKSNTGLWATSPWRMLQVTWDEPEVLQNVKTVSPWQVELVSSSHPIQSSFSVVKKLKGTQTPELIFAPEDKMLFPMTGFKRKGMDPLSSYPTFLAGMQGARHGSIGSPGSLNLGPMNNEKMVFNELHGIDVPHNEYASTGLHFGNSLQLGGSAFQNPGSILDLGTELFSPVSFIPAKKSNRVTLQLFGQIIDIEQPVNDNSFTEFEGSAHKLCDFPLLYRNDLLSNNVDLQCQRVSALEALSL